MLIASIMEEYNKAAWEELIERCQETGVDGFELNFRWGGRCGLGRGAGPGALSGQVDEGVGAHLSCGRGVACTAHSDGNGNKRRL